MATLARALVRLQFSGLANHVTDLRQKIFFLRRGKGHRSIERCDTNDRAIEIIERFYIYDRRDLSGESARARVLVEQDDLVSFLNGRCDGFAIEWRNRA